MNSSRRAAVWAGIALLAGACASARSSAPVATPSAAPVAARPAEVERPLLTLVVGGGPTRAANQVAIESNVRYIGRLLPSASPYRVLFADGDPQSATVQYRSGARTLAYRAPNLPRQDGSADLGTVRSGLAAVADEARRQPQTDVFLYFTGHGSPDRRTAYADNWFALWGNGRFTVSEFARALQAFPTSTPITLVMVQCYSGAFGNVLFEGGHPTGALVEQRIAGFFAAVPERVSAGCTPAIDEAEYKDFTGYFFAALTGQDRLGRSVTGADYDRDGRVGMHEAFAWTIIHDDSIDTPVSTSDTFLRRFVQTPDAEIAATSYDALEAWATPGQRAALTALSAALGLAGPDRLRGAFDRASRIRPNSAVMTDVRLIRFVNLARTVARAQALSRSGDETTTRRYAELLAAESRNPLGDRTR